MSNLISSISGISVLFSFQSEPTCRKAVQEYPEMFRQIADNLRLVMVRWAKLHIRYGGSIELLDAFLYK